MDADMTAWLGASAIVLACLGLGLVGAALAKKDPTLESLRGWRRLVALLLVEPFAAESEFAPRRGWGRIVTAVILVAILIGGVVSMVVTASA